MLYLSMASCSHSSSRVTWGGPTLADKAALLSARPATEIGELKPFYAMAPDWVIVPLAILATMG